MDYCRVVGGSSRPVPAARREARVPNKHFASRTLSGLLESRAKQDDFSRRGLCQGASGQGPFFGAPEQLARSPPRTGPDPPPPPAPPGRQVQVPQGRFSGNSRGRLSRTGLEPGPWILPGWGPRPSWGYRLGRSFESVHANGQRSSRQLGSGVQGLGFRE